MTMALFGRKKSTVGLDIGSGLVKLVEVDHSGDQPEVTRIAVRPLLPDAIVEGEVMDSAAVSDTVRGLFEDLEIKGRNVVTAVGGHDVIIKKIEMDRMEAEDARQVLPFEAERHVPFDIQSVELDFQILAGDADGGKMAVLLVAAKRDLVQDKLALLADAGVEPLVIDVDAFALHNAFEHNHPEALDGIVSLVNVGHEMTNVNILVDGVPILTRDIPFGSRRVREDLQRERGLTAEEAEDVVQGRTEMSDLSVFVERGVEDVAMGVERAAAFLMTRESGEGLGQIFLSGGGARIPGLAEALGRRMGIETRIVNPFERVPVRPGATGGLNLDQSAPMLQLPLGLALRKP
jgi:type IV pilus assembly protein PilM